MADMGEGGGGHEKGGKKRAKKSSTRVDMTPLVDLAFLLLTFFVMTSTFSKPKVMSLIYPAKPKDNQVVDDGPKINNAITFLLSENRIFYYEGEYYPVGNTKGKPATHQDKTRTNEEKFLGKFLEHHLCLAGSGIFSLSDFIYEISYNPFIYFNTEHNRKKGIFKDEFVFSL